MKTKIVSIILSAALIVSLAATPQIGVYAASSSASNKATTGGTSNDKNSNNKTSLVPAGRNGSVKKVSNTKKTTKAKKVTNENQVTYGTMANLLGSKMIEKFEEDVFSCEPTQPQ